MKKYYVTGVSGTGKTTISKELERRGIATFDIDAICEWQHKETSEKRTDADTDHLNTHEWVCDPEVLAAKIATYNQDVVVVGVAANQKHYLNLFDKIFLLQCPEETFIHRIQTRVDNDFGKGPGELETVLGWYRDFEQKQIDRGAIPIHSEGTVDEVTNELISQF